MPLPDDALRAIAGCHPKLRDVAAATAAEWHPDAVPPTVALGDLGQALIHFEPELDDGALASVGAAIERFLAEPGLCADAVATGLLEAVCADSVAFPRSVARVVSHLGAHALAYIRAWDAFTGVTTPGVFR